MATMAEFDLTPVQGHVLRILQPERPLPMNDLAGALHCDASNVTGLLDRLEQRRLVERKSGVHDRRVKELLLTPEGVDLRARPREDVGAAGGDRRPLGA